MSNYNAGDVTYDGSSLETRGMVDDQADSSGNYSFATVSPVAVLTFGFIVGLADIWILNDLKPSTSWTLNDLRPSTNWTRNDLLPSTVWTRNDLQPATTWTRNDLLPSTVWTKN